MTQTKKTDDIRMNLASHDAVADRLEGLKFLFPEAFVEGKVDLERLRQHLGDFSHTGTERYGLTWAGKAEAIRALQIPSHGTLVPMRKESVNFDESENMIIEGDNLEVLKLLQKSYHGKIKMIYIDPPYNTGGDFIYPDNFKEGLETYLKYSGQATEEGFKASTNAESNGRYHSNWLNMMYPRLFMAKNLLRDDGIIFVSIDDSESFSLRLVMNEIFGEDNFIANIVWKHTQQSKNDEKYFSRHHNSIICYRRSDAISQLRFDRQDKDNKAYSNPDNDPKGLWRSGDVRSPNYRETLCFDILTPSGKTIKPPENGWRWKQDTISEKIASGEIVFNSDETKIIRKIYLSEQDGRTPENLWDTDFAGSTREANNEIKELFGEAVFDTPKPTKLIEKMAELTCHNGDLILDFFAGSGSTGHAVINQVLAGRDMRFILVQLPEVISEQSVASKAGFKTISQITIARMERVIKAAAVKLNFGQKGLGFKTFRLSSSNFKLWDAANAPKDVEALAQTLELFADNVLPDRSQEDILYEVILKSGQPLTAKIEKIKVAKQHVFSINGGAMLVCLEDPLEESTLRGMLELRPAVMVALDKAFHGNDQLKTNIKLQAEATGESEQSRVLFKTV